MSTESWAVAGPQTVEVDDVRILTVRLQAGRAEVVADPGRETGARVEVLEVGPRPVQVAREGSGLRLGYDLVGLDGVMARVRGLRGGDRAVVRVTVGRAVAVDVATVEGDAEVTGTTAGTTVRSVTGALRTAQTSGPLTLRTVNGAADAAGHTGDLSASGVSGSLSLEGALGRVSVQTVAGRVSVVARGTTPLVSARTGSGHLDVRLDAGVPVNLKVRGVNGRVTLDGVPLTSSADHTVVVDHVDHAGQPGAAQASAGSAAYVSVSSVTGATTVTRG